MDLLVLAAAIVTMAFKQVIELLTENSAGFKKTKLIYYKTAKASCCTRIVIFYGQPGHIVNSAVPSFHININNLNLSKP